MCKIFNISADCKPDMHYIINIESRLWKIKDVVDRNQYFTINRARQYGKTTILRALGRFLEKDYVVVSLDFQRMSYGDFEKEEAFVEAFAREVIKKIRGKARISDKVLEELRTFAEGSCKSKKLAVLFDCFRAWCEESEKPIVLIIDEVDYATNNQVFVDFLAQLRASYIDRDETPTFWSVILASVYDIKNLRSKCEKEEEYKRNSPWNIAADFLVDMNFSIEDIAGMLAEYEKDHQTGMDIFVMVGFLFDYTCGYPFLVSLICKLLDERIIRN